MSIHYTNIMSRPHFPYIPYKTHHDSYGIHKEMHSYRGQCRFCSVAQWMSLITLYCIKNWNWQNTLSLRIYLLVYYTNYWLWWNRDCVHHCKDQKLAFYIHQPLTNNYIDLLGNVKGHEKMWFSISFQTK